MLQIRQINKRFGDLEVLHDVSFDVGKGEVVAVIGPSGSGKSTLLRCVNQLESVDSGTITVCGDEMITGNKDGKPIYAPRAELRKIRLNTGLVFQSFNLFPHFTVLGNVTEALRKVLNLTKEKADEKALSLLAKMGLSDKASAYPFELSGGQQQRVSIARALALDPQILFFDEPTSALDPELTGDILKVIRALAAENRTMVIVTHEMAFARDVADRVVFMDKGSIIEQGTPEELFGNTQNERIRQFLSRFTES